MRKNLLTILSGLLIFLQACSQSSQPPATITSRLDSFFQEEFKKGKFFGNVLIADKGNVVYQKSFGKANRQSGADLNSETIFELASVSKQFTAMGIMLLVKQGKLKYEDSLRKFFPQLPYYNITVRHLLHHTSGLPDYMELFEKHWDPKKIGNNDDMIRLLATHKPDTLFAPGAQWQYSNTGYALLGSIIEKASGQAFGDYLNRNIFTPLGMTRTSVFRRRYENRQLANYAYGYMYDPIRARYVLPDSLEATAAMVYTMDGIQGDGVVNSTTGDLLKWDRALYTETLLSKAELSEAFTPGKLNNGKATTYGYGWGINVSKQFGTILNHSGGWPGYATYIERDIDHDKTIIVLGNLDRALLPAVKIRNILYGIKDEPSKEVKADAAEFKTYVGDYELVPGFVISITVQDDKIYAQATNQSRNEIFKEKTDLYFFKVVDAKLEFNRDATGKVTSLTLFQNGQEIKGEKIK